MDILIPNCNHGDPNIECEVCHTPWVVTKMNVKEPHDFHSVNKAAIGNSQLPYYRPARSGYIFPSLVEATAVATALNATIPIIGKTYHRTVPITQPEER